LLIFLLSIGFAAPAQGDRREKLQQAYKQFDAALIRKDTVKLGSLLLDLFRMKHSNGLKETKKELLQHLSEGFLKYTEIVQDGEPEVRFDEELGYVNRLLEVSGWLNGQPFKVKLKASEVWVWNDKTEQWQLKWRQSEKLK
jgi:hypothetical protein